MLAALQVATAGSRVTVRLSGRDGKAAMTRRTPTGDGLPRARAGRGGGSTGGGWRWRGRGGEGEGGWGWRGAQKTTRRGVRRVEGTRWAKEIEELPATTYSRAKGTTIGPEGLTAVFGMGTGVAPPVWSPGSCLG